MYSSSAAYAKWSGTDCGGNTFHLTLPLRNPFISFQILASQWFSRSVNKILPVVIPPFLFCIFSALQSFPGRKTVVLSFIISSRFSLFNRFCCDKL